MVRHQIVVLRSRRPGAGRRGADRDILHKELWCDVPNDVQGGRQWRPDTPRLSVPQKREEADVHGNDQMELREVSQSIVQCDTVIDPRMVIILVTVLHTFNLL